MKHEGDGRAGRGRGHLAIASAGVLLIALGALWLLPARVAGTTARLGGSLALLGAFGVVLVWMELLVWRERRDVRHGR